MPCYSRHSAEKASKQSRFLYQHHLPLCSHRSFYTLMCGVHYQSCFWLRVTISCKIQPILSICLTSCNLTELVSPHYQYSRLKIFLLPSLNRGTSEFTVIHVIPIDALLLICVKASMWDDITMQQWSWRQVPISQCASRALFMTQGTLNPSFYGWHPSLFHYHF